MLRTIFVVLILVPGLVMAVLHPFWALLLYLWYGFFRPDEWAWGAFTPLRLSLVIGVLLVGSSLLRGVLPNLRHPLTILTVAFLVTGLLAQTNAIDTHRGWFWIDYFARMVLVCALMVNLITTPRELAIVIAVIGMSMGFHGAKAGLASVLAGGLHFSAGLAGAFVDNNGYALGIVMVTPFLLVAAQHTELVFGRLLPAWTLRYVRVGLYLLLPLCAYATISTFSRGGFLGLAAMVIALVLVHPKRVRIGLAVAAVATVIVTVIELPEGFTERISTIQTEALSADPMLYEDRSAAGRLHFWKVALVMAQAEPLGVGMRQYEPAYKLYDFSLGAFGGWRAVHSSHMQVLAEHGFGGAAVWALLFIYAFVVCLRVRSRAKTPGLDPELARLFTNMPNAMMASMAGFLVGGTFISLALNDITWMTFALLAVADRQSAEACAALSPGPRQRTQTIATGESTAPVAARAPAAATAAGRPAPMPPRAPGILLPPRRVRGGSRGAG